jgi:galactokinase/mevalonate kinase-like predicted kinase
MKSPARIILAGGWSDTPPFCLEYGGDIVNMAVQINKELPITSKATVIPEPVFRLRNVDAKVVEEIPRSKLEDLFLYDTPGNAFDNEI